VWQDSEEIDRDDGWVDTNFGIDSDGNAFFLILARWRQFTASLYGAAFD